MKKGVQDRLAFGVIGFAGLDLVIVLSLITGIDFLEKNLVLIFIITGVIAEIIGRKLSKNYDRDDNYDGYFILIGILLICIAVIGGVIIGKKR